METQIFKLEAPYDYIYCNGEIGKHIATYIVGESRVDKKGNYVLETHSHPIVVQGGCPKGVVWNRAELRDCEILCNESDMGVYALHFHLLCMQQYETTMNSKCHSTFEERAEMFRNELHRLGMKFKPQEEPEESSIEVGECDEGFYVDAVDINLMSFHHVARTLDALAERLKEEREYWEEFYDHAVKFKFVPESELAKELLKKL